MLTTLTIRDLALIASLQLDWQRGMTVLTGETGAGKSILIDAIGLVLGDRADASIVRHGAEQAEVVASFALAPMSPVRAWLEQQAIFLDDELLLRRVVNKDGRSRAFINGSAVTNAQLKELGGQLIDIHGQHEHQRLLQATVQRDMLDEFAGHKDLVLATRQSYRHWQQLQDDYQRLRAAETDRATRLDMLQFQVHEMRAAQVPGSNIVELEARHKRAAHGAEMVSAANQCADLLDDDDDNGAATRLLSAIELMHKIVRIDASQQGALDSLTEALTTVQEMAADLRRYAEKSEVDEAELAELDQQLSALHGLARKHRILMTELPEHYEKLQTELDALLHSGERLDALETAIMAARQHYGVAATALSASRQRAAKIMAEKVLVHLSALNMGGQFEVALSARELGKNGEAEPHSDGAEKIEFLVSANAGQPARPLSKVASGGELSRISLAIQVIHAQHSDLPCLIFDEVDVGIGGATAEIVGRLLRQLGEKAQVLCVTHQAQVAALGHQHYRVQKHSDAVQTCTEVLSLTKKDRIDEVARMVGGLTITDKTRSHAKELLANAG